MIVSNPTLRKKKRGAEHNCLCPVSQNYQRGRVRTLFMLPSTLPLSWSLRHPFLWEAKTRQSPLLALFPILAFIPESC